jgi:hypothetical protein
MDDNDDDDDSSLAYISYRIVFFWQGKIKAYLSSNERSLHATFRLSFVTLYNVPYLQA